MNDKKKEVHDLTFALRETIERHINEYDLCLAEILGCMEVIKVSLLKKYGESRYDT